MPPAPAAPLYYRNDLALVHHLGFGSHAEACAPGLLALLEPTRARDGRVVELGCGSGILTRLLAESGHRVVATDASPPMLDLARAQVPDVELRKVALPDDPVPEADAIVSVGHVLNYLPDEPAIERALVAIAGALRAGGVLAFDFCDLEYGAARRGGAPYVRVEESWTIVTRFSQPAPERFVREITVFVRQSDGNWRRDDERHDNVLMDASRVVEVLAEHGVQATVRASFGAEVLPAGLRAVVGRRK